MALVAALPAVATNKHKRSRITSVCSEQVECVGAGAVVFLLLVVAPVVVMVVMGFPVSSGSGRPARHCNTRVRAAAEHPSQCILHGALFVRGVLHCKVWVAASSMYLLRSVDTHIPFQGG